MSIELGSITTISMMQAVSGLPKAQQEKVLYAVHQYVLFGIETFFKNKLVQSLYLSLREEPDKQHKHAMKNAKAREEKARKDAEAQSETVIPETYSGTESSSDFNQFINQTYPNLANVRVPLTQEAYSEAIEAVAKAFNYQDKAAESYVRAVLEEMDKWPNLDRGGDANVILERFMANKIEKHNINVNC